MKDNTVPKTEPTLRRKSRGPTGRKISQVTPFAQQTSAQVNNPVSECTYKQMRTHVETVHTVHSGTGSGKHVSNEGPNHSVCMCVHSHLLAILLQNLTVPPLHTHPLHQLYVRARVCLCVCTCVCESACLPAERQLLSKCHRGVSAQSGLCQSPTHKVCSTV